MDESPWPDAHYPGGLMDGVHPGLAADCPDAGCARRRQAEAEQPRPKSPGIFAGVQGRCPACGRTALILGSGGYVTCSHLDCPEPDAASTLLERDPRADALTEAAAALQAVIDRNAPYKAESQSHVALCGAREIVLGLMDAAREGEATADPDEGDELVCLDQCGFCDACGMEPFGTPAEGWREAARFLRRTPRESRDYPAVLTGARVIEEHLRNRATEMEQS